MGDYNKLRGCIEVPTTNGPLYLCAQVSNDTKAKYEDWLEGRARRRPFELKQSGDIDDAEFKQSMRSVQEACAAGTFSWGGDAWMMSLGQFPGIISFASILAKDAESGAREMNGSILLPKDILERFFVDQASTECVSDAIREVTSSTPNFLAPPVRGKGL